MTELVPRLLIGDLFDCARCHTVEPKGVSVCHACRVPCFVAQGGAPTPEDPDYLFRLRGSAC